MIIIASYIHGRYVQGGTANSERTPNAPLLRRSLPQDHLHPDFDGLFLKNLVFVLYVRIFHLAYLKCSIPFSGIYSVTFQLKNLLSHVYLFGIDQKADDDN